ncbi:MAG: ABC transporter substrate-binding protein [bacterium]|nr:ABC transporter substrate-binding protein [bacterium]
MNGLCRAISRHRVGTLVTLVLWLVLPGLPSAAEPRGDQLQTSGPIGRVGGRLVVALRAEPKTLNPVLAIDIPSRTIIRRMMADLIHINRHTQKIEPSLARSWTASPDGRRFTLKLRRGLRFSDGHPLDADDVVFTFRVYLDAAVGSPNRDLLVVGGEPIKVRKLGPHTLEFELALPYAVGERLFDSIAILPQHLLAEAYRDRRFADAWGVATSPERMAGLGPFRLKRYVPGERVELERNPNYWKIDREAHRLPYLDELTFLFVPSKDAQAIRFQAGETHLIDRLSAENFAILERGPQKRGYLLKDLGPGLTYEFLFFNLNDVSAEKLPEIAGHQEWFRRLAFRRAVSAAIDRDGIVRLVYQGRATPVACHVTPGNKLWGNARIPPPKRSRATARELLQADGFSWDKQGRLRDPKGSAVEFSIVTNASNDERVRMGTIIQDDLRELGISVHVVPLEFRALLDRVLESLEYDACILGLGGGDVDPNPTMNVWLSNGGSHLWHLGRSEPATPWEAEIDRLMRQQMTALDFAERKGLYDRVQELVVENLPFIFLVSPNVLVGARSDLGNFTPAILDHPTLWNVEEVFWRTKPLRARR